ncbi:hypothetical protein ACIQ9R_04080 [Streptomyces sp. NPDC094447]|uniref:hypothetical protein n=2 Tax=unclassified Streptomyces TaxID=2593676 RepID=UPI003721F8F7
MRVHGAERGGASGGGKRGFVDSPAWMCLSILVFGWAAASDGTPFPVRIAAALLLVAWAGLLARHLVRRSRDRASSPPDAPAS